MLKPALFALIGGAALFFGTIEFIQGATWLGFLLCSGGFLIVHSDNATWANIGRATSQGLRGWTGRPATTPENSSDISTKGASPWKAALTILAVIAAGGWAALETPKRLATIAGVVACAVFVQALLIWARTYAAREVRRRKRVE